MRKLAAAIYVLGAVVTGVMTADERDPSDAADWATVVGVSVLWPFLWAAVGIVTANDVYNDRKLPST